MPTLDLRDLETRVQFGLAIETVSAPLQPIKASRETRSRLEVIVAKQRNGETGLVNLHYDRASQRISDTRIEPH